MTFKPSKFQKNIYNFIQNCSGNAIVEAVAGSGKTCTIIEATKLIPKDKTAVFLAFNKSIASELQRKLPQTVKARTLHSFGLGMMYNPRNNSTEIKMDEDKLYKIVSDILSTSKIENYKKQIGTYKAITSYYKIELLEPNPDSLFYILDRYNITTTFPIETDIIQAILTECQKQSHLYDFDDMIWLPIALNYTSRKFDYIFVDEVQDLNKAQFELVKKICGPKSRIIAVGDSRQSIYAFRGADTNSMQNFKTHFNATSLPLSICYRCPKKIVALAKTFVPEIESYSEQIDGTVEYITESNLNTMAKPGDLILCRTNAPLIATAFQFIRQHKKAVIRGRDIGKNLITYINKIKTNNLQEFTKELSRKQLVLERKLNDIELGLGEKRHKASLVKELDQIATILAITTNVETKTSLINIINKIFSDKLDGIVLSSVHKAKGLENPRVFILYYDELMPHPMAETPSDYQQEINIKYVAVTRAQESLYLVKKDKTN